MDKETQSIRCYINDLKHEFKVLLIMQQTCNWLVCHCLNGGWIDVHLSNIFDFNASITNEFFRNLIKPMQHKFTSVQAQYHKST